MALDVDWRVAVVLVIVFTAPRIDWEKWRKRVATYRNGQRFDRLQRAS